LVFVQWFVANSSVIGIGKLIYNKKPAPRFTAGTVCFVTIAYVVGHALLQHKLAAILEGCFYFALQAKNYMTLAAPMVGLVIGTVLYHPYTNGAYMQYLPISNSGIAVMYFFGNCRPVDGFEGMVGDLHSIKVRFRCSMPNCLTGLKVSTIAANQQAKLSTEMGHPLLPLACINNAHPWQLICKCIFFYENHGYNLEKRGVGKHC